MLGLGVVAYTIYKKIQNAAELRVYRSDNTRYGTFYTDNTAVHIASSTDPIRITSADRTEFYTSGSERMRITSGGYVQINGSTSNTGIILRNNTAADRYYMFVGGGTDGYIADDCYVLANNTDYHIKNNGGGVKLSNGATSWVADSDIRLKDKVSNIDNAIGIISQLETLKFTWKRDSQLENKPVYFGLVAQNAKKIIPEVVDTGKDEMQTLGIRYTEVIPILVKAVQEQQQQIQNQNTLIQSLLTRIEALES